MSTKIYIVQTFVDQVCLFKMALDEKQRKTIICMAMLISEIIDDDDDDDVNVRGGTQSNDFSLNYLLW